MMKFELQEIFNDAYQSKYKTLQNEFKTKFNFKDNKKNSVKFHSIKRDLYEELQAISMKRISSNGWLPDFYTEALLKEYEYCIQEYEMPIIDFFIEEHLQNIKTSFRDKELSIPEHFKFNVKQTVELIARWKATKTFIEKLNSAKSIDSYEDIINSINAENHKIETNIEEDVNGQVEVPNEKELSVRQQVLLFYYIFKALGVRDIDNAVKARLIQKMTGKNQKNIYDAVCTPFKYESKKAFKSNMRIVREEFEKLGLTELASLVLKDTDNN